jgi:hypothetical protein
MNNDILYKFWSEWEDADLDRVERVQKLAFFDRAFMKGEQGSDNKELLAIMFNSYLEDLYEYMVTKYKIEV